LIDRLSVQSLWRYPVKSMAGEALVAVEVGVRGLAGDRAYALVDQSANRIGSAKNARRFGQLLQWRAQFVAPPQPDAPPPAVVVTRHDGGSWNSTDPDLPAQLAELFGPGVDFISSAPAGLMMEIAAGTLGGNHAATTEVPVSGGAAPGTLFNYGSVHLVTTATLAALAAACPAGNFAVTRFRPNIVVDGAADGFPENEWVGREVAIGGQVRLRVSIPCPRCVVTTLPRPDLPLDAAILRTIAERNRVDMGDFGQLPCVGVYAEVLETGAIRQGDAVRLLG
jgi:uncharacterized protein